ncbi:MAG: hypothetical protein GY755_12645 [Chloroflexi bacterium]|nr:hypothetical protein [Chloroflexota bacterium]
MIEEKNSAGIKIARWGFAGTIVAAFVAAILNPDWIPFLQETAITETPTVMIDEVVFPQPTARPVKVDGERILPGEDWQSGCISSESWQVFSTEEGFLPSVEEECYNLIEHGVFASDGYLSFVKSKVRHPIIYGLTTEIFTNANVSVSLDINHIENAEVWVGIADSQNTWNGVYLVTKAGDNLSIRNVVNNLPVHTNRKYHAMEASGHYDFQFEIVGNQWDVSYDDSPANMFSSIELSFSPRYLFIGYRAYPENGLTGNIDVKISNLTIEDRK